MLKFNKYFNICKLKKRNYHKHLDLHEEFKMMGKINSRNLLSCWGNQMEFNKVSKVLENNIDAAIKHKRAFDLFYKVNRKEQIMKPDYDNELLNFIRHCNDHGFYDKHQNLYSVVKEL